MTVAEKKKILAQKLSATTDELILKELEDVFATHENDWWNTLPDNIKEGIETSIKQAEAGELIPHEEVMNDIKKWREKHTGPQGQKKNSR